MLLLALGLAGCGPSHSIKLVSPPDVAGTSEEGAGTTEARQFVEARTLIRDQQYDKAAIVLRKLINAPSFASLPEDRRYAALNAAVRIANLQQQPTVAHGYLVQVTALPHAQFDVWMARANSAAALGDEADQLLCVTSVAKQWPERLGEINPYYLAQILRNAPRISRSNTLTLLRALYASNWHLEGGVVPSNAWLELALLLVEDHQLADAIEVANRIVDVHAVISMRIDRRFDAIVAANPSWFDVDAAAERELHSVQAAADQQPDSLIRQLQVMDALLVRRHYAGMLAVSDSVWLAIQSTNFPEKLYTDYDDQFAWFLESRATALERANRWDEAVAQLTRASRLSAGDGGDNVSTSITLGALYCDLGRPHDAIAAIDGIVDKPSRFGLMALESVRLEAAVQLGDSQGAARSLEYLRVHQTDAPAAYRFALIVANQLSAAAKLLVAQLRDPNQRIEALQEVQDYAEPPAPDWALQMRAREHSVIARPEVQAAIRKVGRVERYDLESP